jgi:hypothetical protein
MAQEETKPTFEEVKGDTNLVQRASLMKKMIPNLIELERKLDVLPDGSFTDEKLDDVFAHIENLAGSDEADEEEKPKKKKSEKKSAKKSKKTKSKKN